MNGSTCVPMLMRASSTIQHLKSILMKPSKNPLQNLD